MSCRGKLPEGVVGIREHFKTAKMEHGSRRRNESAVPFPVPNVIGKSIKVSLNGNGEEPRRQSLKSRSSV